MIGISKSAKERRERELSKPLWKGPRALDELGSFSSPQHIGLEAIVTLAAFEVASHLSILIRFEIIASR